MPEKLVGVESLEKLLKDQDNILRMFGEISTFEDDNTRETLMYLYNVLMSLWMYWNKTGDKEAEYHLRYYQNKFFQMFFEAKGHKEE